MASFEAAIQTVLKHEGGLTDHPADPGGITNFGITLPVLRAYGPAGDIDGDGDIDAMDIRHLTIEDAMRIYDRLWWERYCYGEIRSQWVATKVFDLAVNLGPAQAHLIAQRALRANGILVKEDEILGPITRQAMNDADGALSLCVAIRCEAAGVYRLIVQRKPPLEVFLQGWLKRAYS